MRVTDMTVMVMDTNKKKKRRASIFNIKLVNKSAGIFYRMSTNSKSLKTWLPCTIPDDSQLWIAGTLEGRLVISCVRVWCVRVCACVCVCVWN